MESHSVFGAIATPKLRLSSHRLSHHRNVSRRHIGVKDRIFQLGIAPKYVFSLSSVKRAFLVNASTANSGVDMDLRLPQRQGSGVPAISASYDGVESFSGKSGCVSFYGLTHQSVEESKLVSAPFKEKQGSFLWILGPAVLISSVIVPQVCLGPAIEAVFQDVILTEIVSSFTSEAMFYLGLATFLLVTDRIQRPYLQFSPKRWGLITGLRGYLTSAFFAMGLKFIAPLVILYVTSPVLGLPALVAVVPFLAGCISQLAFETCLEKCGSSCWPLATIVFEVYRIYQLTKATHFVEKVMFGMRRLPESAQLSEKQNALVAMVVTFQVLGVVCLWSLLTFLLRLFPSRPVVENY
uniref:Uncharacterized protein n=2 Tax=Rhizophora mucronata TaxID=61149 RepID=A0A2P2KNN9_RHIMU